MLDGLYRRARGLFDPHCDAPDCGESLRGATGRYGIDPPVVKFNLPADIGGTLGKRGAAFHGSCAPVLRRDDEDRLFVARADLAAALGLVPPAPAESGA